jgi:hypothetical protein
MTIINFKHSQKMQISTPELAQIFPPGNYENTPI